MSEEQKTKAAAEAVADGADRLRKLRVLLESLATIYEQMRSDIAHGAALPEQPITWSEKLLAEMQRQAAGMRTRLDAFRALVEPEATERIARELAAEGGPDELLRQVVEHVGAEVGALWSAVPEPEPPEPELELDRLVMALAYAAGALSRNHPPSPSMIEDDQRMARACMELGQKARLILRRSITKG